VLERVFVQSLESGILPRVVSIDLFGSDVTTGENRSERLHP
jgi:hypothetical protein